MVVFGNLETNLRRARSLDYMVFMKCAPSPLDVIPRHVPKGALAATQGLELRARS